MKICLSAFFLIGLIGLSLSQAAQGLNYCKARQCAHCVLKDTTKYCSSCYRSFKINPIPHPENEGTIGECSIVGYPEESKKCRGGNGPNNTTQSGCDTCEWGFVLSEGTMINGKTDYTCTEPTAKIEKCLKYERNFQTKAISCSLCEKDYSPTMPDRLSCVMIPEASKITNCKFTSQNSITQAYFCSHCEEGYISKTEGTDGNCYPTAFKGCSSESADKSKCAYCAWNFGWWAIDVTAEKGQVCEFASSIRSAYVLSLLLSYVVAMH